MYSMRIRQGELIQNALSRKSIFGNCVIILKGNLSESELFMFNGRFLDEPSLLYKNRAGQTDHLILKSRYKNQS